MNYVIHNYTDGYNTPQKTNARELILTTLKQYSVFGHLRDTGMHQLDLNKVEDWLIDEEEYKQDISELKKRIKERNEILNNLDEAYFQEEYQKELTKIAWHNDPKSNYYASKVTKIENCLDQFCPQLEKVKELCESDDQLKFVSTSIQDMIETVNEDLDRNKKYALQEASRIEQHPEPILSYEEFKKKHNDNYNSLTNSLKDQLKSKKNV